MMKKKKTAALALAAVLGCGILAGCNLVTTDAGKDFAQVIATVDISTESQYSEEFPDLKNVIQPANILKRDMIAAFMSNGSNIMSSYGWTYRQTFQAISESLVNRQGTIQYAMAYLMKKSDDFTPEGYSAAIEGKEGQDKEIAGLAYFLTADEKAKADYSTKRLFNNTLDSQEKSYIKSDSDEDSESVSVRTLPTGVNTANSDYCDKAYKIYTGSVVTTENKDDAVASASASECGGYETIEGSTPATRRKAFGSFLANLRQNDLLSDGEDTTKFETLGYYKLELKSAYESAIVTKLGDLLEEEAEETLSEGNYMENYYEELYRNQKDAFAGDPSSFDSQLDNLSDSKFLLTAPSENYGYVINILLPFNKSQAARVSALNADYGDKQGNSFVQRAQILKEIRATDQRGTWFTGNTDYSWNTDEEGHETNDRFRGTGDYLDTNRKYLFFEDCLNIESGNENESKYEPLKKYFGQYTYNGNVTKDADDKYVLSPKKITVDEFISEMEGYFASAGFAIEENKYSNGKDAYYSQPSYYNEDGKVDYSKFVYYEGKVKLDNFNANRLFVAGSQENKALSVINELSFAYNTDTAGLNSYLGYSIVTSKTSFVSEFEYAAQEVCKEGAGAYKIVPSDYGWHVIYCTFSFKEQNGEIRPFTYLASEADEEGSFSNLFYESVKATIVENYSSTKQTTIVTNYKGCATVYESAYSDLLNLDD